MVRSAVTMTDDAIRLQVALQVALTLGELTRVARPNEPHDVFALQRAVAESRHQPAIELQQRLDLTDDDLKVLWMLVALAVHPDAPAALKAAYGVTEPTLAVISAIVFGDGGWAIVADRMRADRPLRRCELVERSDRAAAPEARWTWMASRRAIEWMHGVTTLDAETAPFVEPRVRVGLDELLVGAGVHTQLERVLDEGAFAIVSGAPSSGRRTACVSVAHAKGRVTLVVDCARFTDELGMAASQMRRIARETRLLGCVLVLAGIDALDEARLTILASELVAPLRGPVFATSGVRVPRVRWPRAHLAIELGTPSSHERAVMWQRSLGCGSADDARYLASRFPLAPGLVVRAAKIARSRAEALAEDDVYAGIREVLDDKLGEHARRVVPTQAWSDLVLSGDQVHAIRELIARIRQRNKVYEEWGFAKKVGKGLGVSALFSGPPGTGKSMVAALIAKDLNLELYQVDLPKIVSKYIGETEKQLAALFDAAEAGHAVLLFDEADALFGKRTEVKSSNDRYANLETNYLLQRMETYTGIVLLTSNHESNIDPAFQRRLSLHLRFDLPGLEERELLWKAMLPEAAPVDDDVDFADLANRYVMSGGYIRNAALRAAFIAADEGRSIGHAHLERAARQEYEGMGKLVA